VIISGGAIFSKIVVSSPAPKIDSINISHQMPSLNSAPLNVLNRNNNTNIKSAKNIPLRKAQISTGARPSVTIFAGTNGQMAKST